MTQIPSFDSLGLSSTLLSAIDYETPTPIQAQSIPVLLEGRDLLAQAQTGTGKTAAFALPALEALEPSLREPQILVIAPTRELVIQVADAFKGYAKQHRDVHVLSVYGGQDYKVQLKALKRGSQVIVGTPGRLMDHMRRGTLRLDHIRLLVLDEADEMLNMGFIEDVEWILEQIPGEHQTALFSATMPKSVKQIADNYLESPKKITIDRKQPLESNIEQLMVRLPQRHKKQALSRFLETEDMQSAIVFVRTKSMASEVAQQLQAWGYSAAELHGDMSQALREKVVDKLRNGIIKLVVATDVAARGIDVERISHVFNYDMPGDAECYIHRIGRTGRAGRTGKTILFVTPRETRALQDIEHTINRPIKEIQLPSHQDIMANRRRTMTKKLTGIIEKSKKLDEYRSLVSDMMEETGHAAADLAAALYYLSQQDMLDPTEMEKADASRRDRSNRHRSSGGRRHGGGGRRQGGRREGGRREGSRSEGGRREGDRSEGGRREGGRRDGNRSEGNRSEGGFKKKRSFGKRKDDNGSSKKRGFRKKKT